MLYTGLLDVALFATAIFAQCNPLTQNPLPRVFVCSDISNEPDDTMSFVRLLVHADNYLIEGLAAVTSVWLNTTTYPDQIHDAVAAYGNVSLNLQAHTNGSFPTADYLHSIIRSGPEVYGSAALTNSSLSPASQLLIEKTDASEEPLYVQLWGGANTVAQALQHVSVTRSQADLLKFVEKLRVYAISDQDDTGPWIRWNFPTLRYIVSIHAWNMYGRATWSGISGDRYYNLEAGGPNTSLVSDEFIAKYFQIGPLGSIYPTPQFIMEGDSPSLMFNIQNGLNAPEHPDWGSWGGRYGLSDISGRSQWYSDSYDTVLGIDGSNFSTSQGTIWRWRDAYQYEMAARMQWTLSSNVSAALHPPVVSVNGSCGYDWINVTAGPEDTVYLDASASTSVDGVPLEYTWFHYREPSRTESDYTEVVWLNFTCLNLDCSQVSSRMPTVDQACLTDAEVLANPRKERCRHYHVILSVKGSVEMAMTRYKRAIITINSPE
jgi:hypothetical protein